MDPLVGLAACGTAAWLVYTLAFAIPYTLDDGLQRPLMDFARLTGPSPGPTMAFIVSVAALFILYGVSVKLCLGLEGSRKAMILVCGFGAASAIVLLAMYPIFSLDIFYYMNADRIWSVYRENPFVVPPLQGAHDPFFPYNAWGHYPLPYGPLWPWITRATSFFGGGAILPTLLAFKGLSVIGYVSCLPILAWAVKVTRPERKLTAAVVGSEVEGQPSYEITETGAADATGKLASELGKTARRTQTRAKRTARQPRKAPSVALARIPASTRPETTESMGSRSRGAGARPGGAQLAAILDDGQRDLVLEGSRAVPLQHHGRAHGRDPSGLEGRCAAADPGSPDAHLRGLLPGPARPAGDGRHVCPPLAVADHGPLHSAGRAVLCWLVHGVAHLRGRHAGGASAHGSHRAAGSR